MDSFYTRHLLARHWQVLSEKECAVIGTVRITNVDVVSRPHLMAAVGALKHEARRSWRLCPAYNKRTPSTQHPKIAENTGYIVLKARDVEIFYIIRLSGAPIKEVTEPDDHARHCVYGVFPMPR